VKGNPDGRKLRNNTSAWERWRHYQRTTVSWAWPIRDNAAKKSKKVSSQDRKWAL